MDRTDLNKKIIDEVGVMNGHNWKDHITFAQWIVDKKTPDIVVDLGVDYGYSTFCFAAPGLGKIYGIDSFEGDQHAGMRNTYDFVLNKQEEYGLNNIQFIKGYFDDVAKTWDKDIDILHIDGLHTYEAVYNDFETWGKFVKDDGVIMMHDTKVFHGNFGVHRFFAEIEYPKVNFTVSHGLGVVAKNAELIDEIRKTFSDIVE